METDPRKYDDADYHDGPAIDAGQPPENAFTHIGLMLAWLIRHELHDPEMWPDDHVDAVRAGEMNGSDLADDCDGKLVSDMVIADGAAFLDARYDAYMEAWDRACRTRPPCSIEDDAAAWGAVEPLIDGLHADWVRAGRPAEPLDEAAFREALDTLAERARATWTALRSDRSERKVERSSLRAEGSTTGRPRRTATDVVAAIPTDLADPPLEIESINASAWGASLLNRALKRLGVRTRDAAVVAGIGGQRERTLSVTVYVPARRGTCQPSVWAPRESVPTKRVCTSLSPRVMRSVVPEILSSESLSRP